LLWAAIDQSIGDVIEAPTELRMIHPSTADSSPDRQRVERALRAAAGSVEQARRDLGLSSRFALLRLMKKHGIRVKKDVTGTP
jgi:transcriptional regulator with GAF, ATPase, and Fis domain